MGLTWALSDGRAGNARQAEALARALQPAAYQPLHLQTNAPWRWSAGAVAGRQRAAMH
ncbi:nucleoside-diphosphate sugar epimerase, partial [Xanthomonas perforans]